MDHQCGSCSDAGCTGLCKGDAYAEGWKEGATTIFRAMNASPSYARGWRDAMEAAANILDSFVADLNHGGRLIPAPIPQPDVVRGAYAAAIRALKERPNG